MASDGPGAARSCIRRFTLGGGQLKRGCDRVEVASRLLLVLVLLVSLPVALAAGTVVRGDLQAIAARQAEERVPTTAVATADTPIGSATGTGGRPAVPARWTAPDGTVVDGTVRAPAGTRADDVVDIWVTAEGRPAEPPMTAHEVTLSTVVVVTLGWLGALTASAAAHATVCWVLGRHRDRRWTRAWAAVEPTWTGRVP